MAQETHSLSIGIQTEICLFFGHAIPKAPVGHNYELGKHSSLCEPIEQPKLWYRILGNNQMAQD